MDFEQEDEGYDDNFQAEAKAFERVGVSGRLRELLSSPEVLENLGKKGRDAISPEDRFLINTDATCRRISSENIIKITQLDIDNMLVKASPNGEGVVKDLRYKNHIAYILGYLASKGGTELKKNQVIYVIENILPLVGKDGGVEPADVVRYSRYWKESL
jgi:hypothetical protein